MTRDSLVRSVKLSCRHLWKIFGPTPSAVLSEGQGIARADLKCKLHQSGHVGAAIDINFDIYEGEIFVIMGLSGSGKSTVVRCLSRLIEPTSGEILLDGEDLLKVSKSRLIGLRRKTMGMVFQNFGLLPHLSVRDNVAFPLRIQGLADQIAGDRADEMIDLVGLSGRERAFPHQLSGGQQQRVGIARSLAVGPDLWFLDEPFSALDPLIRRQMQDEFLRLQRMLKKTIVFITHDIAEAFKVANRIAIMREGEVIQLGSPAEIALKPADEYVREFTEELSLPRFLTAKDLMSPYAEADKSGRSGAPRVRAETTVEALIPQMVGTVDSFTVIDRSQEVVGQLRWTDIVAFLQRDNVRSSVV